MIDLPEPEDSGSSGDQVASQRTELALPSDKPAAGQPLEQAIVGLAANKFRSMGGEVGASLLAGSFSQMSHDLSEARSELRNVRKELNVAKSEIQSEKVSNAILGGKLESAENEKQIRNICLMAGTAVLSFGFDQARGGQTSGWLLFAIGIILILVGWLSLGKKESR